MIINSALKVLFVAILVIYIYIYILKNLKKKTTLRFNISCLGPLSWVFVSSYPLKFSIGSWEQPGVSKQLRIQRKRSRRRRKRKGRKMGRRRKNSVVLEGFIVSIWATIVASWGHVALIFLALWQAVPIPYSPVCKTCWVIASQHLLIPALSQQRI